MRSCWNIICEGKHEINSYKIFSGVGNTKAVAEQIKNYTHKISTEIYSAENLPYDFSVDNFQQ